VSHTHADYAPVQCIEYKGLDEVAVLRLIQERGAAAVPAEDRQRTVKNLEALPAFKALLEYVGGERLWPEIEVRLAVGTTGQRPAC